MESEHSRRINTDIYDTRSDTRCVEALNRICKQSWRRHERQRRTNTCTHVLPFDLVLQPSRFCLYHAFMSLLCRLAVLFQLGTRSLWSYTKAVAALRCDNVTDKHTMIYTIAIFDERLPSDYLTEWLLHAITERALLNSALRTVCNTARAIFALLSFFNDYSYSTPSIVSIAREILLLFD